jgi:hypothetical protein
MNEDPGLRASPENGRQARSASKGFIRGCVALVALCLAVKYVIMLDHSTDKYAMRVLALKTERETQRRCAELLEELNKAIADGNQCKAEAAPLFLGHLKEVDRLGLAAVHAQSKNAAERVRELFGKATGAYHLAIEKAKAAREIADEEKLRISLNIEISSLEFYIEGVERNQEIVRLTLDPSISDMAALAPKLKDAAKRRDEAQAKGEKLAAEANGIQKR